MARPKEFDRDEAVSAAMKVFWERGYDGTSTDDLLAAMGIGRQSMYDTFGDKQKLYFEALRRYHYENSSGVSRSMDQASSPLDGIRVVLLALADRDLEERERGCMGINAVAAFGHYFPDAVLLAEKTAMVVEGAFAHAIEKAKDAGEIAPGVNAQMAGQFLYTALQGLTVRAQGGASREALRNAACFTVEALATMR